MESITIADKQVALCRMKIDDGWSCSSDRPDEMIVPIFPTVYTPRNEADNIYYDAILENVKEGDKVLVVGCGSGADSWVAWTKCKTKIYVIDINEMAILNTYATANIGGFEVRPVLGDIRDMELPDDFKNFDWVLWSMPHLGERLEENNYHDGDDGSILKAFVELLPKLGGKAIIWNRKKAQKFIDLPYEIIKTNNMGSVVILIKGLT